jgi:integrase
LCIFALVKSEAMATLRFQIRPEKVNKLGNAPVQLVYQIKQQRVCFSTGLSLQPIFWDYVLQRAIYIDKKTASKLKIRETIFESEVKELNSKLENIEKYIQDIEKRFELEKTVYNAEMVIKKLKELLSPTAKRTEPSKVLFDFIDTYLKEHGSIREKGSLSVYRAMKNHLKAFEANKSKVTFEKIDYAFFQSFQIFLIEKRNLNNTTVAKQLSTLKTFLSYAKKNGITVNDSYRNFTIKKEPLEVIALTNDEFLSLYNFNLSSKERLAKVRDIFCFACTTGLRYSDLLQLKREHLKDDNIELVIKKTKKTLKVPLNKYSLAILEKYREQLKPLPMISNAKLNDYVKELCKLVGIDEAIEIVRYKGAKREAIVYPKHDLIGVHTGRKTFATLSLERGMTAEVVMATTGHTDYKSFKRYVKITEDRKKIAMSNAWSN